MIAKGRLAPRIAGVYKLDDLAEAHGRFDGRGVIGKLVIQVKA
jgi:NADPH:quinone reductase-like Zn-dependent oxidoreductase